VYNNIGLEPDWTYRVKLCIGNLGKWNSVKWNETHRIGAIFACFYVTRVWQRQLGFLVISMRTCAVLHLLLPGRLSTVPNFTSSLLMLFFVQPLVRNSVINCYNLYILADFWLKFCLLCWAASKLPCLLDTVSKFALFSVSDLKDETLIKSKPTWKLKHANSILETFEYFYQMSSKSILIFLSYTVSKLGRFLRHSVDELVATRHLIIVIQILHRLILQAKCWLHYETN